MGAPQDQGTDESINQGGAVLRCQPTADNQCSRVSFDGKGLLRKFCNTPIH